MMMMILLLSIMLGGAKTYKTKRDTELYKIGKIYIKEYTNKI